MKLIIENWRNYLKEQQLDYKRDKTAMEALAHELARYREKGVEDVAVGTMLIPQDKKQKLNQMYPGITDQFDSDKDFQKKVNALVSSKITKVKKSGNFITRYIDRIDKKIAQSKDPDL